MTVSELATVFIPSPNRYVGRAFPVTKITPHHMGGNCTVEVCGAIFESPARQASSNYGIGSDGRIACYVDEDDAAWTSANWDNDNRAITFEIADFDTGAWSPTQAAWDSTVALCVDICQRYGIPELVYTGDARGNLTEHMMFANTGCPGPWWHANMARLADEVNARLKGQTTETEEDMQFIARPDGRDYMVWFDGEKAHKLDSPYEMEAIQMACKNATGRDIAVFEMGSEEAPWFHRFMDAVNHGQPDEFKTHM